MICERHTWTKPRWDKNNCGVIGCRICKMQRVINKDGAILTESGQLTRNRRRRK